MRIVALLALLVAGGKWVIASVAVQIAKELWVGSFRGGRIARFPATQ
jgi:hypothetical protein